MADKFLRRDATSGQVAELEALVTSAGAGSAGRIPALDSAGRLDASTMPVGIGADTFTANAAGALTAGDLVYILPAGTIGRASAATSGNATHGFVLSASSSGAPATMYFEGRNTALSGLTVGSRYYLSDSSAGGVTATPVTGAGKLHQYVGRAVTTTQLDFEPDDAILLA